MKVHKYDKEREHACGRRPEDIHCPCKITWRGVTCKHCLRRKGKRA